MELEGSYKFLIEFIYNEHLSRLTELSILDNASLGIRHSIKKFAATQATQPNLFSTTSIENSTFLSIGNDTVDWLLDWFDSTTSSELYNTSNLLIRCNMNPIRDPTRGFFPIIINDYY